MAAALIHFDPKQKRLLTRRAKQRGKSFSQAVRDAVDMYLDVPIETEEELSALAREARASADRSIARLDETIAYLDRELKKFRKRRRPS
jgi:hypothetical protein